MNCFASRFFLLLGLFLLCDAQTAAPTTRPPESSNSSTAKVGNSSSTTAPTVNATTTSATSPQATDFRILIVHLKASVLSYNGQNEAVLTEFV
ncbi:hypothetical protein Q5P01_022421 [Channa striata]|uniref:Uncharacterized protein n=1 Tax=Channa striata TaxID=64152 RepID=A0AA88LR15_CHASR|nr:hypothetical protein Q5P01_022421 [Channa striata]